MADVDDAPLVLRCVARVAANGQLYWGDQRICADCEPNPRQPQRTFSFDETCPACGGPGVIESWRPWPPVGGL